MKGKATRGSTIAYGQFGLQATEPADYFQSNRSRKNSYDQIYKKRRKVWIKIFPDKPVTQNPPKPGWVRQRSRPSIG